MQRMPMVVVLIPLIIGILCVHHFSPNLLLRSTEASYLDSVQPFHLVVCDYPKEKANSTRFLVEVLPYSQKIYLYIGKDTAKVQDCPLPSMGDTVRAITTIKRGKKYADFDYGTYLREQGIVGTAFVSPKHWTLVSKGSPSPLNPRQWREKLTDKYKELGIYQPELGTLAALTLGYKDELDERVQLSFQRAGAAHVLAVSGLHVGIIYSILLFILTGFGLYPPLYCQRTRQCLQSVVILLTLGFYAALTGSSPSVVRSVVMISLVEWAHLMRRQPYSLNTLAAAAFIILLIQPTDLFSVSFQLSFAAVTSILILEPTLRNLFPTPKHHRWMGYFISLINVSIAAQLGTLPLALYYFGQTSNYFLLTNIVVLPLAWIMILLAFGTLLLGGVPLLGTWIASGTKISAMVMNQYVAWVEHLPGAFTQASISLPCLFLLYAIIIGWTILFKYYMNPNKQPKPIDNSIDNSPNK